MKKLIAAFLILSVLLTGCAGINVSALEVAEQTAKTTHQSAVSNEETQVVATSPIQENAEIKLQVFEQIFLHVAGNSSRTSWEEFTTILKQENLEFSDDEGIVTVMENNCEGSYLYAVLTNENGIVEIAQLGYYYKATDGEYCVMVDWADSNPRYLTDVTMMDSGTEVTSLTMLESYIVDAVLQSESNVS